LQISLSALLGSGAVVAASLAATRVGAGVAGDDAWSRSGIRKAMEAIDKSLRKEGYLARSRPWFNAAGRSGEGRVERRGVSCVEHG
jgi:hypothetical protein